MRCTLIFVAVVLSLGSAVSGQTLADVAKKEKERREQIEQPSKVYTDADLTPVSKTVAETRRRLAETARQLQAEPRAPSPRSAVEVQRDVAEEYFGPVLDSVRSQVIRVNGDFRRYLDACYNRFTQVNSAGLSFGSGTAWTWNEFVDFAWQESWTAGSSVDNSTTAYCRGLWSDIGEWTIDHEHHAGNRGHSAAWRHSTGSHA